jgi:hypothetical protein
VKSPPPSQKAQEALALRPGGIRPYTTSTLLKHNEHKVRKETVESALGAAWDELALRLVFVAIYPCYCCIETLHWSEALNIKIKREYLHK